MFNLVMSALMAAMAKNRLFCGAWMNEVTDSLLMCIAIKQFIYKTLSREYRTRLASGDENPRASKPNALHNVLIIGRRRNRWMLGSV